MNDGIERLVADAIEVSSEELITHAMNEVKLYQKKLLMATKYCNKLFDAYSNPAKDVESYYDTSTNQYFFREVDKNETK